MNNIEQRKKKLLEEIGMNTNGLATNITKVETSKLTKKITDFLNKKYKNLTVDLICSSGEVWEINATLELKLDNQFKTGLDLREISKTEIYKVRDELQKVLEKENLTPLSVSGLSVTSKEVKFQIKFIKKFVVQPSEKTIKEAASVDFMYIYKALKDFKRGIKNSEQTTESIAIDLGFKNDKRKKESLQDYLEIVEDELNNDKDIKDSAKEIMSGKY